MIKVEVEAVISVLSFATNFIVPPVTKFVIVKNTSQTDEWFIHDDKRDGFNDDNEYLFASVNNVEGTNTNRIRLLSNGFSVPTTDKSHNQNGNEYIALAFGQTLVGTNDIPNIGR